MISVIIPVYNEENVIGPLIAYLKTCENQERITEMLVVDGGSTDATPAEATNAGAKVMQSPKKGRASQMNFGASTATGEILYFVHADSLPPQNFCSQILEASKKGYKSGCFRLRFDDNHPLLKLYAWFTKFDVNAFRFGDQSLFVQKAVFQKLGGFREELIVMEDNEMVVRLKKNIPFCVLPDFVKTSARKYRDNGVVRLQLVFSLIYTGYHLGFSQQVLLSWYRKSINGGKQ